MKKNFIGFNTKANCGIEKKSDVIQKTTLQQPRKSVVHVFFPSRGMGWSYYNDSFDLKVGDQVYVEGKLEGKIGRVTEVNYSFKIKLSDYKKVVAVVDTEVNGDFYLSGYQYITFDRNAIPFEKVLPWFKAPEDNEEFECGDDDSNLFSVDDLSGMYIDSNGVKHGLCAIGNVSYICIDGNQGRAIVDDGDICEIEFCYSDGEISDIKCSCYCSGICGHEFAAMLELKEILELIAEKYKEEYNGYFAAISKNVFINTVMHRKETGKISLEG